MKIVTLELTTIQPLLLTSLQGDPNSSVSFPYIPGSVLRGALIGRYCQGKSSGIDPGDQDVQRLFFNGSTRFLNAYAVMDGERSVPTPRSLVQNAKAKATTNTQIIAYDRSVSGEPPSDDFKAKAIGGFLANLRGSIQRHAVEMLVNIHNQRDRPRGRGIEGQGTLFRYEAIAPGQRFAAAILCDDDNDATTIKDLVPVRLWLGGSRSAGYGETAIDPESVRIVDTWPEWRHLPAYEADEEEDDEDASATPERSRSSRLTITLTSDMFVRDEHGALSAQPPMRQLAKALGVSLTLDYARSTIGSVLHGGFNRTWGLPTPQGQALAAGSVLVFTDLGTYPSPAAIAQLEAQGLGERRAEGFGRVVCNMLPEEATHTIEKWELQATDDPDIELDHDSRTVAQLMARRIRDQHLETRLLKHVEENRIEGTISNTQLSRLHIIARRALGSGTTGDIETFLKNLPANARDQFANARVVGGASSMPLDSWLREQMAHPGPGDVKLVTVACETAETDTKTAIDFTLRLIMAMARIKVKGGEHD